MIGGPDGRETKGRQGGEGDTYISGERHVSPIIV